MSRDRAGRGQEWLWAVWSRRKWLAVIVFATVAVAGVTAARSVPDVYEATATVLVEEPQGEAAAGSLDRRLQLITQEILSRARLERLIYSFGLYPHLRGRASTEALVRRMRRDIRTEFKVPPMSSGPASTLAFAITYRAARPEPAANIANALTALYLEEDVRIRGRNASEAVQVLKGQLDELEGKLAEQRPKMGDGLGDLAQQTAVDLAAIGRLQADLRSRTDERLRALDRRNDLARRLADAESEAPAAGPVAAPTRLARLKGELADLRRRFSDRYPDVVRLKDEIATLEAQEADDKPVAAAAMVPAVQSAAVIRMRESLAEIDSDIRRLRSEEDGLRGEVAAYTQRLDSAPARQRAMDEGSRDYQATRATYDSLRRRYEQAQLDESAQGPVAQPRFRILDAAVIPAFPAAPNRMMLLGLALAAALALAVGAVALREKLDTSFHSADDLATLTRVPVLASIPLIVTPRDLRARRIRFCLAALAVTVGLAVVAQTARVVARSEDGLVAMLASGRS